MITRLTLLSVLACASVAAQDIGSPPFIPAPIDPVAIGGFRPASVEVQFRQGDVWTPDRRTLNAYDEAGRLTEVVDQEWRGGEWANVRRVGSVYDGRDSLAETVLDVWDAGKWAPVERQAFGYGAEGRRSQRVAQAWVGGTWADSARTSYGYDAQGNLSELVFEQWEDQWVRRYRAVSTYDGAERVTERRSQGATASGWEDWSRSLRSHDEAGRVVEELLQNWDHAEWTSGIRTQYAYDAEGRLVEQTGQGRDLETGEWSGGSRQARSYDEAGRLAAFVYAVWIENGWFALYRWTYGFDEVGNLSEVTAERQDYADMAWTLDARFLYAYERATDTEAGVEPSGADVSVAPNPSAGRAEVSFTVPASQDVRVAVYDALGREVAVLAAGPRARGPHSVGLDARLPAGVYVVHVTGETFAGVRSVTLAR